MARFGSQSMTGRLERVLVCAERKSFLTRELWWASNPYSLSAPPSADLLRITVTGWGPVATVGFQPDVADKL